MSRVFATALKPTLVTQKLNCQPFDKVNVVINNQTVQKTVAPCGAIANSLFNDCLMIYFDLSIRIRNPF